MSPRTRPSDYLILSQVILGHETLALLTTSFIKLFNKYLRSYFYSSEQNRIRCSGRTYTPGFPLLFRVPASFTPGSPLHQFDINLERMWFCQCDHQQRQFLSGRKTIAETLQWPREGTRQRKRGSLGIAPTGSMHRQKMKLQEGFIL